MKRRREGRVPSTAWTIASDAASITEVIFAVPGMMARMAINARMLYVNFTF
jgi:hypothetical protein